MFPLSCIIYACMLYYCNMVRWAWLDWGLSGWLTTLLQCFDTAGWVISLVKISSPTWLVMSQVELNTASADALLSCCWEYCSVEFMRILFSLCPSYLISLWCLQQQLNGDGPPAETSDAALQPDNSLTEEEHRAAGFGRQLSPKTKRRAVCLTHIFINNTHCISEEHFSTLLLFYVCLKSYQLFPVNFNFQP